MFKILFTVTVFMGFVMLLRLASKNHISAGLQYALWLLVAVKLLVFPMPNVESDFSVLTLVAGESGFPGEVISQEELREAEGNGQAEESPRGGLFGEENLWESGQATVAGTDTGVTPEQIGAEKSRISGLAKGWSRMELRLRNYTEHVLEIPIWLMGILCAGSLLCAAWMTGYHVRLGHCLRKRRAALTEGPVGRGWSARSGKRFAIYSVEGLPTPCLFGKSIYVPAKLAEDETLLPYILEHEMCHFFHGDMLWGFVRMLCVCLYWYHPLVWAAAYLSRQDCELACDEAVIRHMEGQERKCYGELLLKLAVGKASPTECFSMTTAMSGNARNLKERICRITGKNEGSGKSRLILGIAVMVSGIAGICACVTSGFVSPDKQWQSIRIREREESIGVLQESYEVTYRLSRDAASYGIYMERYEYGELVSAEVLDFAPLRPEGERSRKVKKGEALFARALEADEETGAFVKSAGSYSIPDYSEAQPDGASSVFKAFTLELPDVRCVGNSFSASSKEQLEHRFRMNEDIILLADYYGDWEGLEVPGRHYFSAEKYEEEVGEILKGDRCVILTHLIVSDQTAGELEKQLEELVRGKMEDGNAGTDVRQDGDVLPADAGNGYSDEELLEMARNYYREEHGFAPEHVEIDSENGEQVTIWLYDRDEFLNGENEIVGSGNTRDWYTVDRTTGRGENVLFEEIDLTQAKPLCSPWDKIPDDRTVIDVRRQEDFFMLPSEPETGAEGRLYLLGESEGSRLYGTGDYQSLIWEQDGMYTEISVPFITDGITLQKPEIREADYDGDGTAELAVKLLWGEGTGVWMETLWMFDKEAGQVKAYEYYSSSYAGELLRQLSWQETDGGRRVLLNGQPASPNLQEAEGVSYEEMFVNTSRVSFLLQDGKIKLRTLLACGDREGSAMPAYGDAALEAEVLYRGSGNYSLGDVASAEVEDARTLAQEAVRELYAPREIAFVEDGFHLETWRFLEDEGERMEMTLCVLTEGEDSYDYAEVPLVKGAVGTWETGEILIQK